ncbi:MAG: lytic transglycosylase domain-containing protein [Hyphomicrobiales bacterium]|nr:lytic transglycosylase domain-containing protein [Hyphomicrobiales bacterium]
MNFRICNFLLINALVVSLAMSLAEVRQGRAASIGQLLGNQIPVPILRPDKNRIIHSNRPAIPVPNTIVKKPVAASEILSKILAKSSNLKQGLEAISKKKIDLARAIREGMKTGSLDRKILAWAIVLSRQAGVPSYEIANTSDKLSSWPGQTTMRRNAEAALGRESLSARAVVKAFGNQKPASLTGARLLAKSYLKLGDRKSARKIIAPYWHRQKLSKNTEKEILKDFASVLSVGDHRKRMHYMFYRDRTRDANRMASLSKQVSLAKARSAVSKKSKKAGKLLEEVSIKWRMDPGYQFSKIQYLRRTGKTKQAGRLMVAATRDADKLVHPDEWWVERRVLSRELLDIGKYKLAYKIAAQHSAQSRTKKAEAEFHAGWYALRFLKNRQTARKHFTNILTISSSPISQARGYYWLARSYSGSNATKYYRKAANHQGTYYGQLSLVKLGKRSLSVRSSKPSAKDRANFKSRELVKAISRLEAVGYAWRTDIIYRHLARTLASPGEILLLSARAEKQGKRKLALQLGKIAYGRGLSVITSSWPIGAIPNSAKIGNAGRALAYAIARQESAFDHKAVSGANARGLLQLLPGTARLMAKKTGISYSYKKLTRDPSYNVRLGSAYLSEQLTNFNGSYVMTFSGYNAGPGRAKKWAIRYGDPRGMALDNVVDWVERIPFTETRNYVQRVMENMQVYKARISGAKLRIDKDLVRGRR